jgi:enoyl-CoA hydratase
LSGSFFNVDEQDGIRILRLQSEDGTNRLTTRCVLALIDTVAAFSKTPQPLIITGNEEFFSAGADIREIAALQEVAAYDFSKMGQALMLAIEQFPALTCAAVSGYCMGGGLDLALSCRSRIAAHSAVFGHRGAALALITGWGGTQRLARLVGKGIALEMFVAAEKIGSRRALEIGLVGAVAHDPVRQALGMLCNHET